MKILGISCYYHDSSAALLVNGKVVAAAQEERFTRIKHDTSFPADSIRYCLESQNLNINDIDHIAFYEKPILKFERVLSQCIETFPFSAKIFASAIPSWMTEKLSILKTLRKKIKYKKDVFFIDHHMSHAASFLVSPFKEAAIITVDGVGEWTTTTYGVGKDNEIYMMKELKFPHSLGLWYSTITAYLGFSVNNSVYNVMGLAPYGKTRKEENKYYHKLKRVIEINDDGSFALNMKYFSFHYKDRMPSKKLCHLLGGPPRKKESPINQNHKDIAAALQIVYEETLFNLINQVQKKTKQKNLVLSGGCGWNSVANGKILKNTSFERLWIQPDPGDGGTSLGAAVYAYNVILNNKTRNEMKDAYLGPNFDDNYIETFLKDSKIKYHKFNNKAELVKETARLIFENNVVGWFQGRMEWGPRALGSRSILSNPCNPDMKNILNQKVKHREVFRPFAPVVCEEDANTFFECDKPIPKPTDYMLMVYPIKEKWRKRIPAVTHVDGSGRLQTIKKEDNENYYNLIKEFGKMSGIPILINTSFNIRGEPIVCTPQDAYNCMMGTEIDANIMGSYIIWREENI